jgi:DASS family divalent anion:Na+ symporter
MEDSRGHSSVIEEDEFPPDVLIAKLAKAPVFSKCNRDEVVGLLPFVSQKHLQAGETLCRTGDPANDTWLVLRGSLHLQLDAESSRTAGPGELVGEEAALGISTYLDDIVATEPTTVLAIRREFIPARLMEPGSRAPAFCQSIIQIFSAEKLSFAPTHVVETDKGLSPATAILKVIGWIAAAVLPLLVLWSDGGVALQWEQKQLAAALLSGAVLWVFRLVPPYVTGLMVVLVCVTLGVVPTSVILSGFASSGFFLALSAFCLGAVVIDSGLISRVFLLVMKHCPRSSFLYDLAVMSVGAVLTPLVPSEHDRARIMAPLVAQSAESFGYKRGSRETTRLMLAAFMGFTLFAPILLTGSALNLSLFGSLPEQVQAAFPWMRWTAAAAVAGVVLLLGYFGLSAILIGRTAPPRLSEKVVSAQLKVLGPMRSVEWLAISGAILFLGAVATVSLHKVDFRLIGLSVICGYLVLGALGKTQLNVEIEWSYLILLGTLIGSVATIQYVDLHTVMGQHLPSLSEIMKYQPRVFVGILAATVFIAGLWVPLAGLLVGLYAIPLAIVNGMNPWVVVFVVLLMNDCWFWTVQSKSYPAFRSFVRTQTAYDENLFLKVNAGTVVLRVLALIVSIPYWEYLRIL